MDTVQPPPSPFRIPHLPSIRSGLKGKAPGSAPERSERSQDRARRVEGVGERIASSACDGKRTGGWGSEGLVGWGRREDLPRNPHRSNRSIPCHPRSAFEAPVHRDLHGKDRDEIRSGTSEESTPGDDFRRHVAFLNIDAGSREASSEILAPKGEAADWLEKLLEALRSAAEARASDLACQKERIRATAEDNARCWTFRGSFRLGIPKERREREARRTLAGRRKEPSPNAKSTGKESMSSWTVCVGRGVPTRGIRGCASPQKHAPRTSALRIVPKRAWNASRGRARTKAFGSTGGSNVLDKPDFDVGQSSAPVAEAGGSAGLEAGNKNTGHGEHYRVLLLDHPQHSEKLVVDALPKIVPNVDEQYASNCYHTSKKLGQALVCSCMKEHAEFYAQMMYKYGCRAAVEPDYSAI